jgi:hypothetical protein
MAFTAFLFVGFGYGLAKGGNKNIALWEIRPILYLPLLYFLIINIFRRREQYQRLYGMIIAATAINAVVAVFYRRSLTKAQLASMESLVQHGATLPMNALFVLIAGTWLFKGTSRFKRIVLPIIAMPVVLAYLYSQRRAAIVALIAAVLVLFAVLYRTNRRVFLRLAPAVLVLGGLYTAAFWNSSGSLGFPAQAVKSVIAPSSLSARDQSSDYYRVVETTDILYTIRSSPLTGIGFGQKFYRPIALPGISSFLLSDYMSHNSILWIWMKAGIGGFLAMLYLFGTVMRVGARTALASSDGDDAAITLTSVAFVLMYAVFTYVDIAWDAKSMVFLAVAMAQIASVERRASGTAGLVAARLDEASASDRDKRVLAGVAGS